MPDKFENQAPIDNFLLSGQKLKIVFAIRTNGSMPAREFFDHDLTDSERRKFRPPMERLAETQRVANPEHFKRVEGTDQLWEFKSHQNRILGFYMDGGRFVLAHGLKKKKPHLRQSDIQTAETIRQEFLARDAAFRAKQGKPEEEGKR